MRDAKGAAGAPALHHGRRLRTGPVIRDDDLEVVVALVCESEEKHVERVGPLVRRDDDADRRFAHGAARTKAVNTPRPPEILTLPSRAAEVVAARPGLSAPRWSIRAAVAGPPAA